MINPGYISVVRKEEWPIAAGPVIYCPKCGKPLMEAVADKIKIRCKSCGRWVYLEKREGKPSNRAAVLNADTDNTNPIKKMG